MSINNTSHRRFEHPLKGLTRIALDTQASSKERSCDILRVWVFVFRSDESPTKHRVEVLFFCCDFQALDRTKFLNVKRVGIVARKIVNRWHCQTDKRQAIRKLEDIRVNDIHRLALWWIG